MAQILKKTGITAQTTPQAPSAVDPAVVAKLKTLGFEEAIIEDPYRLILSLSGLEKSSKTHFSLTAPEPIFLFNIDRGTEGVLPKFQRLKKRIYVYTVRYQKGDSMQAYAEMWKGVKERIELACKAGCGTIVMDTATDMYALSRLAHFGKLTQVKAHHYGAVNAEWADEVLGEIYNSSMNAVLIHKLKSKYVNEVRTGDFEVSGFGDTSYKVQCNARMSREFDADGNVVFSLYVDDCRQNASVMGITLEGQPIKQGGDLVDPVCNFQYLLKLVHGK